MSTLKQAFIARYQQWYEDNKELIKVNNKVCNELLKKFNKKYNLDSISTLTLDAYVLGRGKDTFCYFIEYESDRLGGVRGSYPSMKYKVYYSKEGKYTWKKNCSFGNNENEIFDNVKSCLIELIKSILAHNDKDFESNRLNSLFKNKLEYLYNYEESLPIYSVFDVEIVLTLLEINFDKKDSIISKRKKLYEFYKSLNLKNSTPFNFVSFLYSPYYSLKELKKIEINNYNTKDFITKTISDITTLNKNPTTDGISDYKEVSNAELKIIGSYGEDIVIEYLNKNKKKLYIESIYTPCKENKDYEHYDISYTTNDNKTFYIEVKSTTCNNINDIRFEMSSYEYEFMKEHSSNYFIYYLRDVFNTNIINILSSNLILKTIKPSKYKLEGVAND